MKTIITIALTLFLVGCEERYRYPCQDPHNWKEEYCKKPYCSGNGTCPEDISHYLKDSKGQPATVPNENSKGGCK